MSTATLIRVTTETVNESRFTRFTAWFWFVLFIHAVIAYSLKLPPQLCSFHIGVGLVLAFAAIIQYDRRRREAREVDKLAAELARRFGN